jgi:hypothetical protein
MNWLEYIDFDQDMWSKEDEPSHVSVMDKEYDLDIDNVDVWKVRMARGGWIAYWKFLQQHLTNMLDN